MILKQSDSYDDIYQSFAWDIPERVNAAHDVCDRHASGGKTALIYFDDAGRERRMTFADLQKAANSLANAFEAHGLEQGDRVAILLPQCPEAGITHVAAWKMAAISLPLFTLMGEEALEFRLANSGAKALVTNSENLPKIAGIRDRLPDLKHIFITDQEKPGQEKPGGGADLTFWGEIEKASDSYETKDTAADDPCLLVYTSGTTGQPKGALHAHRLMRAHMPSMEFYLYPYPTPGDLAWTPADWAWMGGLMDNLMPAWCYGQPVLAYRARKFDPEEAFATMSKYKVRTAFIPPTALKMMRQVPDARARYGATLRAMFSGGESMGEELLHWGYETLGIVISEGYGQTEFNLMAGNCPSVMDVLPGSMGKSCPGHTTGIIDGDGNLLPPGETGHIAFKTPDPIWMLGYWQNAQATKDKMIGDWFLSGDLGRQDEQGYLWFLGRDDDVITSAGYRIGPGEIEECLMKHPAVALAAAVGVPDPTRTEVVKAFIVPAAGHTPDNDLMVEVQQYVKARLSAHEYPRLIEFVEEMPLTATGKIRRKDLRDQDIAKMEGDGE